MRLGPADVAALPARDPDLSPAGVLQHCAVTAYASVAISSGVSKNAKAAVLPAAFFCFAVIDAQ